MPISVTASIGMPYSALIFPAPPASATISGDGVSPAASAAAVEHDVGRLQVTMQHTLVVGRRQPGAQLPRNLHRLVTRQPADATQQPRQILAIDVLHRHVVLPLGLTDVKHPADVGVRHLARHAHLVEQPRHVPLILHEAARQELQRHLLAELQIVGAVHLAHAAATQQADNAVAPGDRGAGQEAAVLAGVGDGQWRRCWGRWRPEIGGRRRGRFAVTATVTDAVSDAVTERCGAERAEDAAGGGFLGASGAMHGARSFSYGGS